MGEIEIKEGPKVELLEYLRWWREDFHPDFTSRYPHETIVQPWSRLDMNCQFSGDFWKSPWEDIVLAAKELAAIGHITLEGRDRTEPDAWRVRITDAGLTWLAVHKVTAPPKVADDDDDEELTDDDDFTDD